MTSENLVSKNFVFVEIPLRLMIEEKTCGVCWVDHSPTGCFIFCVQSLSIVTIRMDASKIKYVDLVTYLVISTNQFWGRKIWLHISFIRCSQTFYCNILEKTSTNKAKFSMCFLFNSYFVFEGLIKRMLIILQFLIHQNAAFWENHVSIGRLSFSPTVCSQKGGCIFATLATYPQISLNFKTLLEVPTITLHLVLVLLR